jgi:predicted restriction endonuclease
LITYLNEIGVASATLSFGFDIKASSSKWIHDTLALREFAWQDGYGAFTVSENRRESVKRYIQNQEAHHKIRAFEDEYLTFLRQAGVEFDERFLW